jgi:chemotaxis protein MotB
MSQKISTHIANQEEHDEGYFASFTDLLVGILFIFIIMLMMFATEYQKKQKQTEEITKVLERINDSRTKVLLEMEKSLKNEGVDVVIDQENGVLRLPESLLFESKKWVPSKHGEEAIKKLANVLLKYLPCLSEADKSLKTSCQKLELISAPILETVLIEGHTDKLRYGTETGMDSNWGLSAQRAITIFNSLIKYRPELDTSIKNANQVSVLGISAYASRRPVDEENLGLNRRIDLRFIMRSPTPREIEIIKNDLSKS